MSGIDSSQEQEGPPGPQAPSSGSHEMALVTEVKGTFQKNTRSFFLNIERANHTSKEGGDTCQKWGGERKCARQRVHTGPWRSVSVALKYSHTTRSSINRHMIFLELFLYVT